MYIYNVYNVSFLREISLVHLSEPDRRIDVIERRLLIIWDYILILYVVST